MSFMSLLNLFLGAIISILFYIIIIKKIFDIATIKKIYFLLPFIASLIVIINIYDKDTFKILITIPILTIYFKYLFNTKVEDSFLYILIATFYMFIGEILAGIVFSLLPLTYEFIFNNVLGGVIGSLFVIIMTLPFIYVKPLSKISKIIKSKLENKRIFIFGIIFLMLIGSFTYRNIHGLENNIEIYINLIIYIIFFVVVHLLFNQINKLGGLRNEYNVLIKYLERYEKEIEIKRKTIHDYNNQLIVINGYIMKSNKKLKSYVSELIEDQRKIKNDKLIYILDKLPKGLKGLMYYKISQVEQKVEINILVHNNLNKVNNISSNLNKNILKIAGILMDNSIEAVQNTKEKIINVDFHLEKGILKIEIENSIEKKLDKNKIFESGFSTKSKNRGYGLPLIKEIEKTNKNITTNFDIINNMFRAEVIVKIKES